ncbi:Alpha/Beta hydrolase protein [Phascolomyces articulosus]|uniref:Alpha/Beta hydrolase protein n=1 Tax=Phascolomyces articulosus TaxID=60185 RepID=A0AAD5K8I0_9FUNG|nr:Alpha/Beta hydrolase protein [Phascolomyces articulosus]
MPPSTTSVVIDPIYNKVLQQGELVPLSATEGLDQAARVRYLREETEKPFIKQKLVPVIEEDRVVVQNGIKLRLTFFRPVGTENEILPVVIYYHGGGWTFGSKNVYQKPMRDISIRNNVAVVYIDYTLAPEGKFPTINEECYATLIWILENGPSIKIDTGKIAVCGDSAGGHLATAIPLMAKARGLDHDVIKAQIMLYPATAPSHRAFESARLFGGGEFGLAISHCDYLNPLYFGHHEEDRDDGIKNNIFAYPLLATVDELRNLPPALLLTAEADVLRDEGEAYGHKLINAGVPTNAIRILGAIHGYLHMSLEKECQAYKNSMHLISQHLIESFK